MERRMPEDYHVDSTGRLYQGKWYQFYTTVGDRDEAVSLAAQLRLTGKRVRIEPSRDRTLFDLFARNKDEKRGKRA